jgi:hypothetical protein
MQIKFTISSRRLGFENTYPIIIGNLLDNGIPPEDIYFIIGGYDSVTKYITTEGVNLIQVNQNSIDYTGLIAVVEENIYSDYWVLLHDTCYVGSNFYNTIKNYPYNNAPAVALSSDLSMNIGAYSWEYLQNIKDELFSYRNTDFSEESIQMWKQKGINDEDKFISCFRSKYHYCNTPRINQGFTDIYQTGTPRVIEYFPGVDFYKVKANWYNKNKYELNV